MNRACALAVLCLLPTTTAAQSARRDAPASDTQPGFSELYAKPGLVPTTADDRVRWLTAVGGELARSIKTMDGVVDARVHFATASKPDGVFASQTVVTRAAILVTRSHGVPAIDETALRALVTGAVHGLTAGSVSIVQQFAPAPSTDRWVTVGPLRMTADSVTPFKTMLGLALALNALLAVGLAVLVARRGPGPARAGRHQGSGLRHTETPASRLTPPGLGH